MRIFGLCKLFQFHDEAQSGLGCKVGSSLAGWYDDRSRRVFDGVFGIVLCVIEAVPDQFSNL